MAIVCVLWCNADNRCQFSFVVAHHCTHTASKPIKAAYTKEKNTNNNKKLIVRWEDKETRTRIVHWKDLRPLNFPFFYTFCCGFIAFSFSWVFIFLVLYLPNTQKWRTGVAFLTSQVAHFRISSRKIAALYLNSWPISSEQKHILAPR